MIPSVEGSLSLCVTANLNCHALTVCVEKLYRPCHAGLFVYEDAGKARLRSSVLHVTEPRLQCFPHFNVVALLCRVVLLETLCGCARGRGWWSQCIRLYMQMSSLAMSVDIRVGGDTSRALARLHGKAISGVIFAPFVVVIEEAKNTE